MNDDPEIIMSALCQSISVDGHTINVQIYRGPDSDWILEVVDEINTSTVWDDTFTTDQAALDEVLSVIEADGVTSLVSYP